MNHLYFQLDLLKKQTYANNNESKLNQQESEVVQLLRNTDDGLQGSQSSENARGHGPNAAHRPPAACGRSQRSSRPPARGQRRVPRGALLGHHHLTERSELTASFPVPGERRPATSETKIDYPIPLPGRVQGQVGWSSEHPGRVEDVPAHGRGAATR